ncbi:MAG: hypothetical protein R3A13_02575, partial [Bdellovibrionota bacterium]
LAANDFDGDGISDVVLYINQNDGSPNEYVYSFDYSSDDSGLPSSIEFGASGDLFVPGRYNGTQSDLGVVKLDGEVLNWVLRSTETEEVETIEFGAAGDIVLGGCDFDGDALSDLAVFHEGQLRIRKSSDAQVVGIPMNLKEAAKIKDVSCADLDKDGIDELLLLTKETPSREELGLVRCKRVYRGKRKRKKCRRTNKALKATAKERVMARSYSIFVAESYATTITKEILKKANKFLAAFDLDNDENLDLAYVNKASSNVHRINVIVGDQVVPIDLPAIKDVSVGTFKEDSSGVILHTKAGELYTISSTDLELEAFETSASGNNLLKAVNAATVGASLGDSPDGCSEYPGIGNGFLWKPVSESTGKLVVLLPSSYRQKISGVKVMSGSKSHESLAFAGDQHNGGRPHYRSYSKAGKNFPDGSYVAVAMKQGGVHCFGPIEDTSQRAE